MATALRSDEASAPRRTAMARVLHVINGENYSGAERVQDLLALGLPANGYEVVYACVKPGRFEGLRMAQEATFVNIPMRSRFDLSPVMRLARLAKEWNCQLVHTNSPRTLLVGRPAARIAKLPLVHHVQSPAARETTHRFKNFAIATVERISLKGVPAVIAASGSMADYLRGMGVRGDRIHVVPNGCPTPGTLREWKGPQRPLVVGMVANFRPRKGVEVLLEALHQLRRSGIEVHARLTGQFQDAEYEKRMRAFVSERELESVVEWTGFTKDIHAELARLDVFVLPSLFGEALPLALLEAMGAGIPVVSTLVEGIPEAVRQGVDGLLTPPGDPDALAKALASIARGEVDVQSLRRSAYERQKAVYSDVAMSRAVAAVYNQTLGALPKNRGGV